MAKDSVEDNHETISFRAGPMPLVLYTAFQGLCAYRKNPKSKEAEIILRNLTSTLNEIDTVHSDETQYTWVKRRMETGIGYKYVPFKMTKPSFTVTKSLYLEFKAACEETGLPPSPEFAQGLRWHLFHAVNDCDSFAWINSAHDNDFSISPSFECIIYKRPTMASSQICFDL